jgi:predicted rRNA methylase YqxC with S4 and FtsJ domains
MYLYNYKVAGIGELAWYENVYKEIWFDHEYSRYGVEVEKNDIVVDCGANVGFFTLYALNKGAKHVYSIECDDKNMESLHYNLENTNSTIIKEYVGFGDENIDIENIFKRINEPFIDFIKIDIEWAEYDLLLNTPDNIMKRVNKWVIEVHDLYSHYYKIFQIIEKFSKNGFVLNLEHVHKDTNLALLYAKKR